MKITIFSLGGLLGQYVTNTALLHGAQVTAYVPDAKAIWPRKNMTVIEGSLQNRERVLEALLQIVRLTETGKKRAGQFSLGMKQRLGIAVALLNNPKLLILDEPTNGLDPIGIEELRELIRSFPAKGITVILSSHILSEVQQTADHIGIIAGGVLGYEGKLNANENLEQLFMDVVKSNHREG